ncbi:hypothetical protein RX327_32330 [Bradyrhizobium sp. BEA-2-5]|uniref:hypothetical protein n=1 Tax=Bradyrhizobium sp. BEA-2-5 TaxID=3080015 RepID=UPI00293E60BC|nr:hypothetical protein [Bradyrhizobium sp. BEA-2-5]WOH80432.1 hypothetical protein RX327_32330 [Bradyrhizobium sp. BEA-2-5]
MAEPPDGVVAISSAQLGYLLSGIDGRHPQETWRQRRLAEAFSLRLAMDVIPSLRDSS